MESLEEDRKVLYNSVASLTKSLHELSEIISKSYISNFTEYNLSAELNTMMKSMAIQTLIPKIDYSSISKQLSKTITLHTATQLAPSIAILETVRQSMQEMVKPLSCNIESESFKLMANVSESLKLKTSSLLTEQMNRLKHVDYSTLFAEIIPKEESLSQIIEETYHVVNDGITGDNQEETFTEQEILDSLNEQIENPIGFQARVAGWAEKKKVQFFIIWHIILIVYGIFVQPYLQEKIGLPVMSYIESQVRQKPSTSSDVIGHMKENTDAIILEDVNYYYKVTFTDENGEMKEGFVAKRNVKIIERETEEIQDGDGKEEREFDKTEK